MPRLAAKPKLPRNVWVLGFVSLLMDLSSEIYHALLPLFITVTLGLPATALGAIDGIAEATANFAKLASGRLSDRSRRRKHPRRKREGDRPLTAGRTAADPTAATVEPATALPPP